MGLNSALKDIEKYADSSYEQGYQPYVSPIEKTPAITNPVKAGIWRERCEDGSEYGLCPEDFETADDYEDALAEAKQRIADRQSGGQETVAVKKESHQQRGNQYRWRLHCEDGSQYGISPDDYESADDYAEALDEAKRESKQINNN